MFGIMGLVFHQSQNQLNYCLQFGKHQMIPHRTFVQEIWKISSLSVLNHNTSLGRGKFSEGKFGEGRFSEGKFSEAKFGEGKFGEGRFSEGKFSARIFPSRQ